jgi:endonuclease YncB( thermonuclease family)
MRAFLRDVCTSRRVAVALASGIFGLHAIVLGGASIVARAAPSIVVSGKARIVDGDTIDVGGQRVRLEGIDAPELSQTCPGRYVGGFLGPWKCGQSAAAALADLIGTLPVTCKGHGFDGYGRLVASCSCNGHEVSREMVRLGQAWAFTKYSANYVLEERRAREAKLGIWASLKPPQPAWMYRSRKWSHAAQRAPDGCAIKGNIPSAASRSITRLGAPGTTRSASIPSVARAGSATRRRRWPRASGPPGAGRSSRGAIRTSPYASPACPKPPNQAILCGSWAAHLKRGLLAE